MEHNTKNATCTVLLEIGHGENEVEENFYFAQYERLLALRASQRKISTLRCTKRVVSARYYFSFAHGLVCSVAATPHTNMHTMVSFTSLRHSQKWHANACQPPANNRSHRYTRIVYAYQPLYMLLLFSILSLVYSYLISFIILTLEKSYLSAYGFCLYRWFDWLNYWNWHDCNLTRQLASFTLSALRM